MQLLWCVNFLFIFPAAKLCHHIWQRLHLSVFWVQNSREILPSENKQQRYCAVDLLCSLTEFMILSLPPLVAERPQHMLMRVAVGIHGEEIEKVVEVLLVYVLAKVIWFDNLYCCPFWRHVRLTIWCLTGGLLMPLPLSSMLVLVVHSSRPVSSFAWRRIALRAYMTPWKRVPTYPSLQEGLDWLYTTSELLAAILQGYVGI